MRAVVVLSVILVWCTFAATAWADDADSQERERLVGVWQGFVVEGKGENPNRGPVKLMLHISKEGIVATEKMEGDLGEGTFSLDLAASPRVLDAKRSKAPGVGQTFLGIYELDGDTLRWCVGNPRKDRPTSFETKTGGGHFLMILKRKTP